MPAPTTPTAATPVLNVLVFPYGTEIANEIVQALRHHKRFKLLLATGDRTILADSSHRDIEWLPFVLDPAFEERFLALLEARQVDLVVPAHDDAALVLSRMDLPEGCVVVGQDRSVNEIVRFKDRTYGALAPHVAVPRTFEPGGTLPFPVFVKPRRGQGSKLAFRIDDQAAFERFASTHALDEFVVSEHLPGEEYTVDCFSTHGRLRFAGPRTRDRTSNGISVRSSTLGGGAIADALEDMARAISAALALHGLWFFQAKLDRHGIPRLLEVGPRVSGTMMVNRVRGVNFVELAIHQALGDEVQILDTPLPVTVTRTLRPTFHHALEYRDLYVDFDDTLLLDEETINLDVVALIFQTKNRGGRVFLITKNRKNNLARGLHRFGITSVFDGIHHLRDDESKADHLRPGDLLVDDSFAERSQAIRAGAAAIGLDAVQMFLDQ